MTPTIDTLSLVTRFGDHISSRLDEELVIMSITNGKYYGLDPIARRIWKLLEQPRRVWEICALIGEEYEVERERCEADILALLRHMRREKLIAVKAREA